MNAVLKSWSTTLIEGQEAVRRFAHSHKKFKNGTLAISRAYAAEKKLENVDRKTQSRAYAVVHVILAVGVIHVDVIVVAPANWPRLNESEVVAAVCEAMTVVDPRFRWKLCPLPKLAL